MGLDQIGKKIFGGAFLWHCFFFCMILTLVSDCRLDAAVLDLVADDGQGMKQQKTNYHWDKVIMS